MYPPNTATAETKCITYYATNAPGSSYFVHMPENYTNLCCQPPYATHQILKLRTPSVQMLLCSKNSKYFVIRSYPRETIQLTNCLPPCCLRAKPELGSASTQASDLASCDGTARLWQLAKAAGSKRGGTPNTLENHRPNMSNCTPT